MRFTSAGGSASEATYAAAHGAGVDFKAFAGGFVGRPGVVVDVRGISRVEYE